MEALTTHEEDHKMNNILIKRKRTKRHQRPHSPIQFTMIAPNSSSGSDGSSWLDKLYDHNHHQLRHHENGMDEEEDMANCLILLAQGRSRELPAVKHLVNEVKPVGKVGTEGQLYGINCYECKTCNRAFPSFQALGGHRASHKKNKLDQRDSVKDDQLRLLSSNQDRNHREEEAAKLMAKKNANNNIVQFSSAFTLQLSSYNRGNLNLYSNNKSKVHECSICGAEFASGQALGGHMRRHRTHMGTSTKSMDLSLITTAAPMSLGHADPDRRQAKRQKSSGSSSSNHVLSLNLDLNLPAAPEDDHDQMIALREESKLLSTSSSTMEQKQQHVLGFAPPTLVDCHY